MARSILAAVSAHGRDMRHHHPTFPKFRGSELQFRHKLRNYSIFDPGLLAPEVILFLSALMCLLLPAHVLAQADPPSAPSTIRLAVDLSESARRIFHAKLTLPAKPGPMALLYPKWIPGEHAPDGPIADLVGLRFTGEGKTLAWRRDDAGHLHVSCRRARGRRRPSKPPTTISRPRSARAFPPGRPPIRLIAVLEWNLVVLYPAGAPSDSLTYQASLRLPAGLEIRHGADGAIAAGRRH